MTAIKLLPFPSSSNDLSFLFNNGHTENYSRKYFVCRQHYSVLLVGADLKGDRIPLRKCTFSSVLPTIAISRKIIINKDVIFVKEYIFVNCN